MEWECPPAHVHCHSALESRWPQFSARTSRAAAGHHIWPEGVGGGKDASRGGCTSLRRCKILGHADGKIPGLLYGLSSRAAIARTCRCRRRRRRCRRARFASCAANADCCTGELVAVRAGGSGVSLSITLSGPAVVLSTAPLLLL